MFMARYKYKLPDSETAAGATPTTNVKLADTAENKKQNYLSGKEAYAADYNQTAENLKKERTHRGLSAVNLPAVIAGRSSMKADQITALRKATKGLVNYNGSGVFPWGEEITALVTKLKARHLEEIRQVIDDALNNARCSGGCSSVCGRGCGNGCVEVCKVGCGTDCSAACGSMCKDSCGNSCTNNCGESCKNSCGDGCKGKCGAICAAACSDGCKGNCGINCGNGCSDGCKGQCGSYCASNCGLNCD
jgi:hypothetical protein